MTDERPPILDRRNALQIAAQTELLARRLLPEWRPGADDPVRTLIALFGHLMEPVIARLNRVPAKQRAVFTELVGLGPLPPRPARAPVTFTALPGAVPTVPPGTVLDAKPADGDPEPLQFVTEEPLTVHPASLVTTWWPGARDPAAAEPWLYITHPALGLATGPQPVRLIIKSSRSLAGLQAWTGAQWQPVAAPDAPAGVALASLVPCRVGPRTAPWLRLPNQSDEPPTLTIAGQGELRLPLDAAAINRAPVDPTATVCPFGQSPSPGDAFYVRCDRAAARGGDLALEFTGVNAGQPLPASLQWQVWTGAAWRPVAVADATAGLTKAGRVGFTDLPPQPAGAWWLRLLLVSGGYNRIPSFAGVALILPALPASPAELARADGRPVSPPPDGSCLLLGFDRPFEPRPVSLFFEVTRAALREQGAPPLRWSYATGQDTWAPLAVDDATSDLQRSGVVRFTGPADLAPTTPPQTLVSAAWLRVEGLPPATRLGPVRLNTVWARQSLTIADDREGPSGGARGDRPAGAIQRPADDVPGVDTAKNHLPSVGGRAAETREQLAARTTEWLRHRGRAVAGSDYVDLALAASPQVARAWVVPLDFDVAGQSDDKAPALANRVRVVVVPHTVAAPPDPGLLVAVESHLRMHAPAGVIVDAHPPTLRRLGVTAKLRCADDTLPAARAALGAWLDPLRGGQGGRGFPPGVLPALSDLVRVLTQVPGLRGVDAIALTLDAPDVPLAPTHLLLAGALELTC